MRHGAPHCTYGLRVPASCVPYVHEAQGGLPPGPHALFVLGTCGYPPRACRTYRDVPAYVPAYLYPNPNPYPKPTLADPNPNPNQVTLEELRYLARSAPVSASQYDHAPPLAAAARAQVTRR